MLHERVEKAADFIGTTVACSPEVAIVLGSGLGALASSVETTMLDLSTQDIPGWPRSTVTGHEGRLIVGTIGKHQVLLLKGRVHAYEGYSLDEVCIPVRVAALLGARSLVLTNSAGGIDPSFNPGDIMLIEDHLNLQGTTPLRGPNVDAWGVRFPDMSEVYDRDLGDVALEAAEALGMKLRRGVYASLTGPVYETPAEVRMLAKIGAQAVGMSTVPEAIVARHMGLRVLGFSVISNAAAGLADQPLSHEEVVETGRQVGDAFTGLVLETLKRIPGADQ